MLRALKVGKQARDIIILVMDGALSINYSCCDGNDFYVVRNVLTFLVYIGELFKRPHKQVTIVLMMKEKAELAAFLRFVYRLDQNTDLYRDQYIQEYQHHLNQLNGDYHYQNEAFGQYAYELPLACNLVLVLDSTSISENHLSTTSIATQQYLRYIGLKHGAKVIATPRTDSLIEDPLPFILYNGPAKPIFDTSKPTETIPLHLHIPRAWDSCGKILLLAKSVIYDHSGLIENDEYLQKFDEKYSNYFNGITDTLFTTDTNPTIDPQLPSPPLTLNDILRHSYIE